GHCGASGHAVRLDQPLADAGRLRRRLAAVGQRPGHVVEAPPQRPAGRPRRASRPTRPRRRAGRRFSPGHILSHDGRQSAGRLGARPPGPSDPPVPNRDPNIKKEPSRMTLSKAALAFAPFFTLALAACGGGAAPEGPAVVQAEDAWCRPTPNGVMVGGCYVTLVSSRDDRLLSASSPRSEVVEIHEMRMDGDMMRMGELQD